MIKVKGIMNAMYLHFSINKFIQNEVKYFIIARLFMGLVGLIT